MSSEDFKRDFNIYAKLIYREWLMEAIEEHKEKFHKLEKDVNKYYEKYKKEFLKSEKDVLKIFEIDYYLWNKEKQS